MKIFAKRTKKKTESSAPRTINKSDPIVEELLNKDPSEWNAKERRMVKRYRERNVVESKENAETDSTGKTEKTVESTGETEKTGESTGETEQKVHASEEIELEDNGDDDDDDSSSDSGDDGGSVKEDEKENDGDGESSRDKSENSIKVQVQHSTIETEEKIDIPDGDNSADEHDKVGKDHEIWSVLDKLNSKQKRTLSRKLDRIGKSVLEEVEQEANKILDEAMPIVVDSKRDLTNAASSDKKSSSNTAEPKKKKRKKAADWSSLTPEERLRREDQRKKQEEAAERRIRGESIKPGHKRPLNSERRRANRRKPKWKIKTPSGAPDISSYKQEHHSSGFLHRRNRGEAEPQRNNY